MLMTLSFFSDAAPQEDVIALGNWALSEETTTTQLTKTRCFISTLDTNHTKNTQIKIGQSTLTLQRNDSAEVPLFYFVSGHQIWISDSVYELQEQLKQPMHIDSAYAYLYSQFLPKERTLFQGIYQVLNNQSIDVTYQDTNLDIKTTDLFSLPMTEFQGMSERQLTNGLREAITEAHAKRLGSSNALFLSGGLDSQVMAITLSKDLALGSNVSALHFSVKNARQTELKEAELTAKTLNLPFHAVEVDSQKDINFERLLKMNAPYLGAVSIHQLLENTHLEEKTTVFAGQDTRLHTPSLQAIDEKILALYKLPGFGTSVNYAAKVGLTMKQAINAKFDSRLYRKLSFFSGTDSSKKYLANRFFHIAHLPFQDKQRINNLRDDIVHDLANLEISNKRELFNTVAKQLWRRQFIYDINYMSDTINDQGYKVAMPFYDEKLAYYSAQLPFNLASKVTRGRAGHGEKETSVNKYLLRKAYDGELDDSLVYRDKAVCLTAHMFFNGGLLSELESFISASWLKDNDVAHALHLVDLQSLCARKHENWLESDHWLMMTVFNALIIFNHLRRL